MKHVGKMKNNSARIAIVFRTLPGDVHSALVIGTTGLGDMYHDNLMSVLESESGQQANELADIIAVRKFPDGNNMLEWLHINGHLKKVPTKTVLVTPDTKTSIPLDELNKIIAEQKGLPSVEDLNPAPIVEAQGEEKANAASEYSGKAVAKTEVKAEPTRKADVGSFELTPAEMRSRADTLFKEAQRLRKEADAQDPPKKKAKAEISEA
jgi:hypothetical protein